MSSNKKLKSLTDKDLIIFLVACGINIEDIKKDGNRSLVYFENTDNLKESILNYANRATNINISDYLAAEKRVTTLLYTQKQ